MKTLVEQRERKSLEAALLKERRIEDRERQESRAPQEPVQTHTDRFNDVATTQPEPKKEAERVEGSGDDGDETSAGSAQQVAPEGEITIQRRKRPREHDDELDREARRSDHERDGDDPSPDRSPRRRRDRDFGPDR
jgi:hypothetical protein